MEALSDIVSSVEWVKKEPLRRCWTYFCGVADEAKQVPVFKIVDGAVYFGIAERVVVQPWLRGNGNEEVTVVAGDAEVTLMPSAAKGVQWPLLEEQSRPQYIYHLG